MKTIFTIGKNNTSCNVLLLEIGEDYCCYALLKGEERTFYYIKYLTYDRLEIREELARLFDEIRSENCDKVIVCSAFSESMLVPQHFNQVNEALMDVVFEKNSRHQLTDSIPEWQINTVYSMPAGVYDVVTDKFPGAKFFHAYTPSLKIYNGFVASNQIDIHFSTQNFRIVVKKEKQVQLAQTYSYKNPLDVVYYLLKICYEFQLSQSEVFIIVSGLIEEDSALYKELHNYFLHLHFAQAPAYSLPDNAHPHYYFTSLYNLAACVS